MNTAPIIEAKSISSLNSLLANPPQYPRNPTHEAHEPLILYIVRVPGSKDVFLTPLKPPTKASVSLEAIQTSLYYLHVETPEDHAIRKSLEDRRKSEELTPTTIQRKPLPPTPYANYPARLRPPTPPKSYPHYQPAVEWLENDTQAARYAARGSHLRLNTGEGGQRGSIQRKPLGSRPLAARHQSDDSERTLRKPVPPPDIPPTQSRSSMEAQKRWSALSQTPVAWSPRSGLAADEGGRVRDSSSLVEATNGAADAGSLQMLSTEDRVRITLIRRDPSSGSQWNVGTIIHSTRHTSCSTLRPVDVLLDNPGYSRFVRDFDAVPDDAPEGHPSSVDDVHNSSSPTTAASAGNGALTFKRTVGYRPLPSDVPSKLLSGRNSSDILVNLTNASAKRPRHAYSFLSPWQGICTFTNGVDGRSLRCRHALPALSSASEAVAVDVAELRFNLSWSVLGSKDSNVQSSVSEAEKLPISQLLGHSHRETWRRSIQHIRHKSHSLKPNDGSDSTEKVGASTQDDSEIDPVEESHRISLKLGREKAGGGFKGNSAKLGKLIIEDEGLKMCDLVVAACMGVWWQHYTESSRA